MWCATRHTSFVLENSEWPECGKAGKTHSQSPSGTIEAGQTKTSVRGGGILYYWILNVYIFYSLKLTISIFRWYFLCLYIFQIWTLSLWKCRVRGLSFVERNSVKFDSCTKVPNYQIWLFYLIYSLQYHSYLFL